MKPENARTEAEVLKLPASCHNLKDFWILTDGCEVTIMAQRSGEPPAAQITIPRRQFLAMIRWFQTDQPEEEPTP